MPLLNNIKDAYFLDCGVTFDVPIAITGATAANPVVITAVAHGLSNGDIVDIDDIIWEPDVNAYGTKTQPDQLNGQRFTIANKTADTFELTGENGTAFNAYSSGGEVRKTVLTISGLWHINGAEVVVLADGEEVTGLTVASGAITLPSRASRVHIGLPYVCDIELLDIEYGSSRGPTLQGKMKSIGEVTLRFEKTRHALVGPTERLLTPLKESLFDKEVETVNGLLTGDLIYPMKPQWNSHGRLLIRQRGPFPMTLLAAIPEIDVEDDNTR